MKKKLLTWWYKQERADKIAIVLGIIAVTYFLVCWLNVVTHNQTSGYTYPWWNFFKLFGGM